MSKKADIPARVEVPRLRDKWIDDKAMVKMECLGLIAGQIADRIDAAAKRGRYVFAEIIGDSLACGDADRLRHLHGKSCAMTDEQQPIIARIWPIIEVPYCDAIPSDYPGPMGVPISYMDKHSPDRFIILDHIKPKCHGKDTYERIVIVNKHFCTGRFQVYKKLNGTYFTAERVRHACKGGRGE